MGKVTEERVPGLTAVNRYSKLIVLGKPGAGKTTFLKHLAIECIGGQFQASRVPVFIILKQFAESEWLTSPLDKYITRMLAESDIGDEQVKLLLNQGRLLVLLDALDEVRLEHYSTILNRIRDFSEHFSNNQFVITCRIAAMEYTFENFTEVEIADFDDQQIAEFARKWFQDKEIAKNEVFVKKLSFNQPIKELATNPLLLTLMCLIFETKNDFPSNRSRLYKEGLDLLLNKWDVKRNIERSLVYKNLSIKRKKDLLSSIALNYFERGEYFFKQKDLERYIGDYIRKIPDAQTDPEAFQLDIEAVLKSIEAQHGLLVERAREIYSFSHLTFQEYLTAIKIVDGSSKELNMLASHITDRRWHEVFLLTVEIMHEADELLLLMKQEVDKLISSDQQLRQLISWVIQKSDLSNLPYKPAWKRAFYLTLFRVFYRAFARAFKPERGSAYARRFILNLERARHFPQQELDLAFDITFNLKPDPDPALVIACILTRDFEPEIKQLIQQLEAELPHPDRHEELKNWNQANGEAWTERLRAVMTQNSSINNDWQLEEAQINILKKYIDANNLLMECMNRDCSVSQNVRDTIENALFLL